MMIISVSSVDCRSQSEVVPFIVPANDTRLYEHARSSIITSCGLSLARALSYVDSIPYQIMQIFK